MKSYSECLQEARAAEARLQEARRAQDEAFTAYMQASKLANEAYEREDAALQQHPMWLAKACELQRASLSYLSSRTA